MRGSSAVLGLISARARRRPGRWLLPALGIAAAAAFGGCVAAEGAVAGDQSARAALSGLPPLDRAIRVTWQGVVTPAAAQQARALLGRLQPGPQSQIILLSPVRLSGVLVRPAAIAPLDRWLPGAAGAGLGRCRATSCPMLLAGGPTVHGELNAIGVRIPITGAQPLRSAVPLGFSPATDSQMPLLLTGDLDGLEALPGLSGVYRAHSWLTTLATARLHSWQLSGLEARLASAQSALLASGSQFRMAAPFAGLDSARAQAAAAPRRLLLTGGGALAALAVFIVLAAGGLRKDQRAELDRLRSSGARLGHCLLFVIGECTWLTAVALLAGAGLALGAATVIAVAGGEPPGGILTHSLVTPVGLAALAGGWLVAIAIIAISVLIAGARAADALAIAAVAALAVMLGVDESGNEPLVMLLAPLCCLAAGVLAFRLAAAVLRAGERIARRGPVLIRLALVGLARAPVLPSLAIAFVAVTVGLGGFALAYRATLLRGAADQAADHVPLDAIISPGADFKTPLDIAPLTRWKAIAGGAVLPVRRTEADYANGGGTVTVPALGVPAGGLALLHGWRKSDGSAPLTVLARRLRPPGPVRVAGPKLPASARSLRLQVSSPALGVSVTADLRDAEGRVRQVPLGTASGSSSTLQGRVPAGQWELEALELDEPTGLEITNGHQNGENPAAATQFGTRLVLGQLRVLGGNGEPLAGISLAPWRAVGAAATLPNMRRAPRTRETAIEFATSGTPGVLRPAQPSDLRPVPVLADPQTAAAAGPGGRLALTVDGLPVTARVMGTLRRFSTLTSDAAGFVVADQATLSSALDAELPGQGRTDELWIATGDMRPLRAALGGGAFAQLDSSFRADWAQGLRSAPIARAVLRTLIAAAIFSAALALLGMLVAFVGSERDRRVESDLEAQGIGPRGIRDELRVRLLVASGLGVAAGALIAVLLTLLAVASVRASATAAAPRPPLVTVIPWAQLVAWTVLVFAALAAISWLATWSAVQRGRAGSGVSQIALGDGAGTMREGVTS